MEGRGKILAVIGGQYGSEGKGVVVAHLADRYPVHVRVGSHNAGHSFKRMGKDGQEQTWKMQQIPVGWANRQARLFIGAGALVSPETLLRELQEVGAEDPSIWRRLGVDAKAGILDTRHQKIEGGTAGKIHQRIGSTGEGVGAARIARLMRQPEGFRHFADLAEEDSEYGEMARSLIRHGTARIIQGLNIAGYDVLLEGSQGVGLSITHGPWPYVTTTDCGAAQLCADVGLPPQWVTDVLCVVRTYPIRVAGNSGPLENEITWDALSSMLGRPVQERTTVTKKVRRIGLWDPKLLEQAILLNRPSALALMFADYLDADDAGKIEYGRLSPATRSWVENLERTYEIPVQFVGTGGEHWEVIER